MKTNKPNEREDWEERIKKDLFIYLYNDQLETYWDRSVENVLASFHNLIQSHNNALVAEIEKLKRSEENANASGLDRERNETVDTIIRIIQEK